MLLGFPYSGARDLVVAILAAVAVALIRLAWKTNERLTRLEERERR